MMVDQGDASSTNSLSPARRLLHETLSPTMEHADGTLGRHDLGTLIVMALPRIGRRVFLLIPALTLTAGAQPIHSPGRDPRLSLSRLPVTARVALPRSADWMAFGFGSVWVVNYRPSRVSRVD